MGFFTKKRSKEWYKKYNQEGASRREQISNWIWDTREYIFNMQEVMNLTYHLNEADRIERVACDSGNNSFELWIEYSERHENYVVSKIKNRIRKEKFLNVCRKVGNLWPLSRKNI